MSKIMSSKEIMMKRIDQHQVRVKYFNKLKSLQRATPGSEIIMVEEDYATWPVYILMRKKEVLAKVSTSGSLFLNHWFTEN